MNSNHHPEINRKSHPIPDRLNLMIAIGAMACTLGILVWTSMQESWLWMVIGAIAFSFINNTCFSLLHEATHGQFHSNRKLNLLFGRLLAAFFPTSFTMQQMYHLGHHRRNRTDAEMFDLYYPGDNLFLKRVIIYGVVTGVYWITPFISCLMFLINPKWILGTGVRDSKFMQAISADHMLGGLERVSTKVNSIRGEILFTIAVQGALIAVAGLGPWFICYLAFGINWGSLQYADHVGSARDIREGAWNLKVSPIVRWLFLNYHLHLVHHRHPNLPWIHLPKFFKQEDGYPTFRSKLWEFISGPRLTTEPSPTLDRAFESVIFDGTVYSRTNEKPKRESEEPKQHTQTQDPLSSAS